MYLQGNLILYRPHPLSIRLSMARNEEFGNSYYKFDSSYIRIKNEYAKMTENERAYKRFYCKITNYFKKMVIKGFTPKKFVI